MWLQNIWQIKKEVFDVKKGDLLRFGISVKELRKREEFFKNTCHIFSMKGKQ